MNPVKVFEEALLSERVATRYAKEFPSQKALKDYLRKHPKADRSQHSVKHEEGGRGWKPDVDMSDVHPTDDNYDAIKKLRETKMREQAKERKKRKG